MTQATLPNTSQERLDWSWHGGTDAGLDIRQGMVTGSASSVDAISLAKRRLWIIAAFLFIAYLGIGARLIYLGMGNQVAEPRYVPASLAAQHMRSDILDRNGRVLAKTLTVPSLSANPSKVRDPMKAAAAIVDVLGPSVNYEDLVTKLSSDRSFVWIKRGITPEQVHQLNWKGVIGLEFQEEQKRVYPHGGLTSHAVGFNNIDNQGLAGLERSMNGVLAEMSEPLRSSIDLRLQHIVADELDKQIKHFDAKAGAGVMMDVNTGEIVAMVSLPTYDPHAPQQVPQDFRFNRAAQGVYELGSVFKLFTVAMALDEGVITEQDKFDISKPLRVANRTIRDFHPEKGLYTAEQILEVSSNIGSAQIALKAGGATLKAFMDKFGFLAASPIEIPEIGMPLVPDHWRTVRTATISYGHGLSVSPVQLASGVSALVNGGYYVKPTLISLPDGERAQKSRVLSPETSQIMRKMMEEVVVDGTGRNSAVSGYRVGGKTGTADKPGVGGYQRDKRIATFASAFPIDNPQYALVIVVDEPQGRKDTGYYATGGVVAAPISKNVISRSVSILGIPPTEYANSKQDTFWQLMNHSLN